MKRDRPHYYNLVGQTPVPCGIEEFGEHFDIEERRVASTDIGPYRVSTVFLGIDHGFADGPPILFETMVFADDEKDEPNELQQRCSTWSEAEAQHARIVDRVTEVYEKRLQDEKVGERSGLVGIHAATCFYSAGGEHVAVRLVWNGGGKCWSRMRSGPQLYMAVRVGFLWD